jgi:Barstar (barnase inhibitor).
MIDSSTMHAATAESIHFAGREEFDAVRGQLAPLQVFEIGAEIRDDRTLFAAFAAALEFPDYFGHNWDALDECLRDLGWLDISAGLIVVLRHSESLWKSNPVLAGRLVELWLTAAEDWRVSEVPFHLVFEW